MQILPSTQKWMLKKGMIVDGNLFDSEYNFYVGKAYLNYLEKFCSKHHPNWEGLSLDEKREILAASYNGGATRLKARGWDISKMPKETRKYVASLRNKLKNS